MTDRPVLPAAPEPLSAILADMQSALKDMDGVTVGALAEILRERGTGALMVLFALLLALPSGILPGLNTILAIPLIILAAQLALGRKSAWLPAKLTRRQLDPVHVGHVIGRLLPPLRWLEKFLKRRWPGALTGSGGRVTGVIALIVSLFAAIPVPLTHTVPGAGLLIFSIGLTTGDGLIAVAGLGIGVVWGAAVSILFLVLGPHFVSRVTGYLHPRVKKIA